MARLRWKSVLSSGSQMVGPASTTKSNHAFLDFEIPVDVVESAAGLVMFSARNVDKERNYILHTVFGFQSQPSIATEVTNLVKNQSFDSAKSNNKTQDNIDYVSRILPGDLNWSMQVHRIPPGLLQKGHNSLCFCSRNRHGFVVLSSDPDERVDTIQIARVFVIYTSVS